MSWVTGRLFLIDLTDVEDRFLLEGQWLTLGVVALKEATLVAGVTGPCCLVDLEEKSVFVAVGIPANDFLRVPAGFTFEPELSPGAAPVMHFAGAEGEVEGLAVHPGHHEDAPARDGGVVCLLDDNRDEPVGIELEVIHLSAVSRGGGALGKGELTLPSFV